MCESAGTSWAPVPSEPDRPGPHHRVRTNRADRCHAMDREWTVCLRHRWSAGEGVSSSGDTSEKLVVPSSWPIGNMTFMTAADALSSLKFLRQQADGVDAYLNTLTGQEVYIGRTEVIEGRSF